MSLLTRWDPWAELEALRQRMNQLFEETVRRAEAGGEAVAPVAWMPAVDVKETPHEFTVYVELPGVKPEEVSVQLRDDNLIIEGERKFEDEEHRENYIRRERAYGRFRRVFRLATPVQEEQVTASYRDGVLTIVLPKAEAAKPRRIEVKAG